jgi:uncharacterized surface protein with fasciclin (FAS1) repeats
MKNLVISMKTTSKTIFGLLTLGFVLSTVGSQSWAQSSAPEKPMKPQVLKILCERSPLNSRCPQGGAASGTPAVAAPTGGGMTPAPDKTPVPVGPSGGGELPPTTPSGGVTPSTPVPDAAGQPAGGGTMAPAAPGSTVPEAAPMAPSTDTAPKPPKGTKKPVGPSSANPVRSFEVSAEPSTPKPTSTTPKSSQKSSGSASDLTLPAAGSPAVPASPTDSAPVAPVGGAVEPTAPSAAPPTATPTSPVVPDKVSPAAPTSSGTVVDVIGANEKLTKLASAIKAAGLDKALAGKGPFTIFAPSDEAFAALPPTAVTDLLKPENKAKLAQLLKYHVVSGKLDAASLKSGNIKTLQGKPITVKVEGGKVMVNSAMVTEADVPASNGVVHIIDKVILPSR